MDSTNTNKFPPSSPTMDSPIAATAAAKAAAMGPATTYDLSGKSLLTAVLILLSAVLLLLFSHAFARWYLARRIDRRSRRRRLSFAAAVPPPPGGDRGLNAALLSSLPILPFASADEEYGPDECAVCLCEFEAGDGVRVLPRCGHTFHAECIDMWFYSHSTCPLCRCAVDPAAGGGQPGGDLREVCRREDPPAAAPDPAAWEEGGVAADPVEEEEEEKGLLGGWEAAVRHIFSWELGFQCGCAGGGGGDLEMGEGEGRR